MKKLLVILFALVIFAPAWSQENTKCNQHHECKIEEFVDNLTPRQKHKIDDIYKKSKVRTDKWESELRQVRDSINVYLSKYGDYSNKLFPLFSREASLRLELNKERYRLKIQIDKVLTKEQYNKMQSQLCVRRHKCNNQTKCNSANKNCPNPNSTPHRPQPVPHKTR